MGYHGQGARQTYTSNCCGGGVQAALDPVSLGLGTRNCHRNLRHHDGSESSPIPQTISPLSAMSAARAFSTALRAGAPRAPIARFAATRSYAAAATGPASKPPVALFGVDGTYASALVRLPELQLEA
jgi:hypothetical protein